MKKTREHWDSNLGFILASIGSAVGLGTLWKFPYVTGMNGGGLFYLIYILCVIFLGLPLFIGENLLGRKTQKAAVSSFSTATPGKPGWRFAGWLGVTASFLIMSYYSIIAGAGLSYTFLSLSMTKEQMIATDFSLIWNYFMSSADIVIFWHLAFTFLTGAIVYCGIREGIEKWSKLITTVLFSFLIGLFFYSLTLPGSKQAFNFLFSLDYSKLTPAGILQALGLSFFTLSLGQGIMLTYGSYLRSDDNIPKTALIVATSVIITSMIAGLTIFSIIFSFGLSPQEGVGLVFKVMPTLLAQLPMTQLLSFVFFSLFVLCGLTSAVALIEVVSASLIDLLEWPRKKAVFATTLAAFLFGIPSALAQTPYLFNRWEEIYGMNFLNMIDDITSSWIIPLAALLTSIYLGWVLDKKTSLESYQKGMKTPTLFTVWHFLIKWVIPSAISIIILRQVIT